ncbi:MAG: DUF3494 domain-containing protein [Thermoplasmata archaeon]|nr:DUF3494 domain-containing protein [Thermoplasmata archaeon]
MLLSGIALTQGASSWFAPSSATGSAGGPLAGGSSGVELTAKAAPGCAQSKVALGSAGNFRVLAGTTVTSTGATVIHGNLGVSPGSAVTGFPPGTVTGKIYAADTTSAQAQLNLTTAYNNASGRTTCEHYLSGNLGGLTIGPGLYHSNSSLSLSSGSLTLDAHGNSSAVFIFQIATKLSTSSGRHMILTGGAKAGNIYWVVGSSATFGTTSIIYGTLLAHVSISFATGAVLHGRALAQTGAVTFQGNPVSGIVKLATTTAPTASIMSTVARSFQ